MAETPPPMVYRLMPINEPPPRTPAAIADPAANQATTVAMTQMIAAERTMRPTSGSRGTYLMKRFAVR